MHTIFKTIVTICMEIFRNALNNDKEKLKSYTSVSILFYRYWIFPLRSNVFRTLKYIWNFAQKRGDLSGIIFVKTLWTLLKPELHKWSAAYMVNEQKKPEQCKIYNALFKKKKILPIGHLWNETKNSPFLITSVKYVTRPELLQRF